MSGSCLIQALCVAYVSNQDEVFMFSLLDAPFKNRTLFRSHHIRFLSHDIVVIPGFIVEFGCKDKLYFIFKVG